MFYLFDEQIGPFLFIISTGVLGIKRVEVFLVLLWFLSSEQFAARRDDDFCGIVLLEIVGEEQVLEQCVWGHFVHRVQKKHEFEIIAGLEQRLELVDLGGSKRAVPSEQKSFLDQAAQRAIDRREADLNQDHRAALLSALGRVLGQDVLHELRHRG